LLIGLPIVTMSIVSFIVIRQNMVEKLQMSNDNLLNVMAADIEKTIDDISFSSHFMVNDSSFHSYLKDFADIARLGSHEDYSSFVWIGDGLSLISSKPLNNYISMYLINRADFMIASNSATDLTLIKKNLPELMEKVNMKLPETLQWLGMTDGAAPGKGSYFIARVIYDREENRELSVLLISLSQPYFENVLQNVEFGETALFDSSGVRIAGSEKIEPDASPNEEIEFRSEVTLGKTNWTLVYEAAEQEIFGRMSQTFYVGFGIVMLSFIIFSVFSMFVARRLHNPIQKLQRVVRQFGGGNLDARLEVKGQDDIAELGHTLNTMLDQIKRLISDIENEQERKRVMELEALFMQIRPHFLINTLNSIKCSLILKEDLLHSGTIDSLMSLLRAYLKVNEPAMLKEECKLLGNYIDIMKIRNEIPLTLVVELEDGLEHLVVPKLALQPLVENAIVHGLTDEPEPIIRVRGSRQAGRVVIAIEDNGSGMEETELERLNARLSSDGEQQHYERVGLVNVLQRLRLTFGPSTAMEMRRNGQGGVTVVLTLNQPMPDRGLPGEERGEQHA
jgi:sensor histidine kinase YesM